MLRKTEWSLDGCICLHCDRYPYEGHHDDCPLTAMIAELEAVEGTAAKVQRKENESK